MSLRVSVAPNVSQPHVIPIVGQNITQTVRRRVEHPVGAVH